MHVMSFELELLQLVIAGHPCFQPSEHSPPMMSFLVQQLGCINATRRTLLIPTSILVCETDYVVFVQNVSQLRSQTACVFWRLIQYFN